MADKVKSGWYDVKKMTLKKDEDPKQGPDVGDLSADSAAEYKAPTRIQGALRGKVAVRAYKNGPQKGLPPEIWMNEEVKCVRRFYNNAAVASASTGIISTDDIFGAIGQIGRVSNTSTTCVATSFQIEKVCIYPPSTSSGSSWVDLLWGGPNLDNVEDRDRNITIPYNRSAVDGFFEFRPPKNSTAGQWVNQTGAAATIFYITLATAGSVVDVHLKYTTPSGITASGTVLTHGAVTVGSFYRGYLNSSAGADSLVPVDFTPVT